METEPPALLNMPGQTSGIGYSFRWCENAGGALSLTPKVSSSPAKRHSDAGLLYVVCTTDPTMGGATASAVAEI